MKRLTKRGKYYNEKACNITNLAISLNTQNNLTRIIKYLGAFCVFQIHCSNMGCYGLVIVSNRRYLPRLQMPPRLQAKEILKWVTIIHQLKINNHLYYAARSAFR